ncbi:transcriptional regulator, partial [Escherichia coli]|nr:transcriptional regulator [Escherichia coli]EEZ3806711.1 transcriptional regulator [Escherichia coli O157:H7]EFA8297010.1 transcriptional regulator [Escherichia coli O157]EES1745268.1 transcriptional regulator [Escherichia coli]EES1805535.1 transcriptional regulator [Escherichia coli]
LLLQLCMRVTKKLTDILMPP